MTNGKYRYFIVVILSFIFITPSARGDEFRIVPSISAREEYNSNVFLTADDQKSDFITTLSPGFDIVKRNERLDTSAQLRLDWIGYADNRDFNATDQTYKGKIRYRLTPIFGLSAEAGYLSDYRPDRDLETTGLVTTALRRERINTGLSTDYQFTEKTALSISYAYGKETFEKKYSDTLSHEVNAGLVQDFSKYFPAVKGMVNVGYSYFDFADSRIDSVMGTMGISRDFNEIWGINVSGGARYTESQFSVVRTEPTVLPPFFQLVTDTQTNDGWGWVGQASLTYKGQHGNGEFTYGRDVKPASGQSSAVERNTLALSMRYRITYELSASLNAGYYTNKSGQFSSSTNVIDEQSFRINPRIKYEFSKDVALEASYGYSRVNYRVSSTEAERHLFFLRLLIQHPFLE